MMRDYYCATIPKNYEPRPTGCPRLLFALLAGTPHILLLRVYGDSHSMYFTCYPSSLLPLTH